MIVSRTTGQRLSDDERETLRRLVTAGLPTTAVVMAFEEAHGVSVSTETVCYYRRKHNGPAPVNMTGTRIRPPRAVPDSRCCRCRTERGTLPGLPLGLSGRVCLRCQQAVIDEHREEEWRATRAKIAARAQMRRASA